LKGFQEQTKKKKVGIFFMTKQVKIWMCWAILQALP
jgi:hypothetical protein